MRKALFLLLATLLTLSCSHESDEPDTAQKTVFVFMPYSGPDSDLHSYFLANLRDMETSINAAGGLGNNNIVVFKASKSYNGGTVVDSLIQIKYKRGRCVRQTLNVSYDYDYTTPEGMAKILRKVKTIAPADSFAMIVGCHGEGWKPKNATQTKAATRFFGGCTAEYQIDITDFAQGIEQAGMHFQFILFDDCYLSCIENAYDLRQATDYLIASTSEIMATGMPYSLFFAELLKPQPDYSKVCDAFISYYNSYPYPYGTIGVTDCRLVGQMADMMRDINSQHEFDTSYLVKVQDLDGTHCNPTVYFDFGDYVRYLLDTDTETYQQFTALLDRLVPSKGNTEYIFSMGTQSRHRITAFSGLTVSDPTTNTEYAPYKTQTNWWKATH